MTHGRRIDQWDHTALLYSLHVNLNQEKSKKSLHPDKVNPYRDRVRRPSEVMNEEGKQRFRAAIKGMSNGKR